VSSFSYAVDLGLAREVLTSLAAVEAELDEIVVDLRWRVARLHSTWAGTAAAAHLSAHSRWEASYRDMHTALCAMRACVRTAASNYDGASASNTAMWNDVR
jgi:WXG100 family type VII secretion target